MNQSSLRFSIDAGGTFTDIVVLDETTGDHTHNKTPSTPDNPLTAVFRDIEKAGLDLTQVKTLFVHGSTIALNTLLQKKGAKTAYIATKGYRDVPEIARFDRGTATYQPKYRRPEQIVPRHLRFEVAERTDYLGNEQTPLDEADVRKVAKELKDNNVEAVAICFLHAYKNPNHEARAKKIIEQECPGILVRASSDTVREHREYERSMTTILNAYLSPVVNTWLEKLESELKKNRFGGRVIITRSDGGGMISDAVRQNAIQALMSGPAGGVIGGLYISQILNQPNLITFDMGGTSTDVSLIKNGESKINHQAQVSGYGMLMRTMDIKSVGAGGGSISWIDVAGALHVGPQSAGADPGPICYNRGGTEPTVTDAALCCGYIDPNNFLGGEMSLEIELSRTAIQPKIGKPLKMDLQVASSGILRIALSNIVEAIRSITVEEGDDPRDFGLLCYGGAGPLFGAAVIEELNAAFAIVPVTCANFSAWGMLMVDIKHDFVRTLVAKLDEISLSELEEQFAELEKEGEDTLSGDGIPESDRSVLRSLDMRYLDQEHTVDIPIDSVDMLKNKEELYAAFRDVYQKIYGYSLDVPAEIVNLRIVAIGNVPKPNVKEIPQGSSDASQALKGNRSVYCFVNGELMKHNVYDRELLQANNCISGPALVDEATSVTAVLEGQQCEVDRFGNLIIKKRNRTGRKSNEF